MDDPDSAEIRLYCGSATPELAAAVAARIGIPLGGRRLRRFPDSEVHVQIEDSIRGKMLRCGYNTDFLTEVLAASDV